MTKETVKIFHWGRGEGQDKTWSTDSKRISAINVLKFSLGIKVIICLRLGDSKIYLFFLYMQDSVINSTIFNATSICLLALVHAEVSHFAAQVAFLDDLFIFFVQKNSLQLIFLVFFLNIKF